MSKSITEIHWYFGYTLLSFYRQKNEKSFIKYSSILSTFLL